MLGSRADAEDMVQETWLRWQRAAQRTFARRRRGAAGETERRLYLLDAWRETGLYSARERAALEWTEAVTRIADGHVPDEVFASARNHFTEEELVDLTIAVISTNGWNRLNVAFRPEVGGYRPGMWDQPKAAQATA